MASLLALHRPGAWHYLNSGGWYGSLSVAELSDLSLGAFVQIKIKVALLGLFPHERVAIQRQDPRLQRFNHGFSGFCVLIMFWTSGGFRGLGLKA